MKYKKDLISIKGLLLKIKQSPEDFKNLEIIYQSDTVGKKGRNKINTICQNNNIKLFDPYTVEEEIDFFELITGDENKINEIFSSENHNIILSDHDDYEI